MTSTVEATALQLRWLPRRLIAKGSVMMIMGRLGFVAIALVLVSATGCGGRGLTADAPVTPASWRLASPADPQATNLEIEVMTGGCFDPDGPDDVPLRSIDVVETSSAVEISVTLEGLEGCPPDESGLSITPAIGFTSRHAVQLASPLGDRTLIDPACDEEKFSAGSCEHPAR